MANLAIKGHPTRGSEVIALLEMLGGINEQECNGTNSALWYSIDGLNKITFFTHTFTPDDNKFFTLKQFLEKYPYKVGDKVMTDDGDKANIVGMVWDNDINDVFYETQICNEVFKYPKELLQPYKEETMEKNIKEKCDLINFNSHYIFDFADRVELVLKDDWEVKNEDGKTFVVRKQSPYPKTYHECWKIVGVGEEEVLFDGVTASEEVLFDSFIKLKRCRDAYWKIAGSWKPDWVNRDQPKFVISIVKEKIELNEYYFEQKVLAFPTEEMRDAFYENFKELIETVKELL